MDLRELYQEMILDHNRHPRNRHAMEDATTHADGNNPLCGDQITVYLRVEDGIVREASFEGHGCAISTASASMMTEAVVGKTREEAEAMFETFRHAVTRTAPSFQKPPISRSSRCCPGSRSFRCASSARRFRGTPFTPRSRVKTRR